MSNTDSFIDEVTEEVRRDRLFRLFRRYGWIAALLVIVLVGGAAYNEWRKASAEAQAQATGDAVLAALDIEDTGSRVAAIEAIEADGNTAQVIRMMAAAEALANEDPAASAEALQGIIADQTLSPVYRDLAELKLILLEGHEMPADERRLVLERLATPGAPYRLLAEEQLAVLDAQSGDTEAAIERLKVLAQDTEVTAGLRRRASQLIVALGGSLDGL